MGDYLMSLIKANDLTNVTGGIPTVKSQQLIPTAWVNFNGTGTIAIRDSENISSITDVGTGHYQPNFTALANANYATFVSGDPLIAVCSPISTTRVSMQTLNQSVANVDVALITFMIMGGQS